MSINALIMASMLLRLATFFVVLNYYKVSRHRNAWLLIAAAMMLLALENLFQLLAVAGLTDLALGSTIPHTAGFIVSVLMLTGTALISNILKRLASAERKQESIEKRFQLLFDTTSDLLFVITPTGSIIEANQAACEKLGYNKMQLLEKRFADIKAGPSAAGVMDHVISIKKFGMHIFETELLQKDGKVFPVEINCRLIEIEEQPYISCIARSISERKELDKKVRIAIIETEETERKRFAKEIHDGLGPLLSAIKLYVNELDTDTQSSEEREEFVRYINQLIDDAVDSARNIANNITPKILSDYGLTRATQVFCDTINATNLLRINTRFEGVQRNIDPTLELIFYRIITELINNTIKHANATKVEVELKIIRQKLVLIYTDNGIGFDLEEAIRKGDDHMGVKNIISRVRSMNGAFYFRNTQPGIHINIDVDLQQTAIKQKVG